MKPWIRWIVATLILALIFHLATVMAIPRLAMKTAHQRILERAGSRLNTLLHSPRVTVDSRNVVKPSPDLLYSLCVYDVSEKPLRITAPVPDTYWSLSFYQTNTDNFYVLNDRRAKTNPVEIVLVGPKMAVPNVANAEVVVAPTTKGIFLLRSLIMDEDKLADLIRIQKMARCKPL